MKHAADLRDCVGASDACGGMPICRPRNRRLAERVPVRPSGEPQTGVGADRHRRDLRIAGFPAGMLTTNISRILTRDVMDQHQLSCRWNLSSQTFLIAATLAMTGLHGWAQTGTPRFADAPTAPPQTQAQSPSAPPSQSASAQGFVVNDYSKPHPALPNVHARYTEERIPPRTLKTRRVSTSC